MINRFYEHVFGLTRPFSISIGYFPPVKSWSESLEAEVKNTIYEYQLYFAKEECIKELEGNVRTASVLEMDDGDLFTCELFSSRISSIMRSIRMFSRAPKVFRQILAR